MQQMVFFFIHFQKRQNLQYNMKEYEIRPKKFFDEYLRLAKEDTETFFSSVKRVEICCPACNATGEHSFNKNGFDYSVCNCCHTFYVNPRPEVKAFTRYYTESPSSKFWATTFYKETAEARREKIWKPKAQLIANILHEQDAADHQIIDIGGGYGIFTEEIQKYLSAPVIIIEPSPHLAKVCRNKGFEVIEKFLEDVAVEDCGTKPKTFVSFELFEHLYSPEKFLINLNDLMIPNDLFIFTTLSGTGLDIQILWENSPSVSPPHHLNFFNPKSVKIVLKRMGFELIQVSTPGKLDLDILNNNKDKIKDRFWNAFLDYSDDNQKEMWQALISESGWSSHMMVVCKKV